MEKFAVIGKNLPRIDGAEKVTGSAKYSVDVVFPKMLYAKVLRSPHPHAKILKLDTSKAERVKGVRAVITAKDMPNIDLGFWSPGRYSLAVDKVRFAGEEMAAIAAIDEDTAEEALELIEVEYEELPPIMDPEEAMEAHIAQIHATGKNNIAEEWNIGRGDISKAFREADYVIEDKFKTQCQHHSYLEPICCVADFDANGKITLWTSSMDPYNVRQALARVLDVSESKVRIIQTYVGGAFGAKIDMYSIYAISAQLAKKTQKPVRIENNREEEFISTFRRFSSVIRQKIGVKQDGKIVAREISLIGDAGGYNTWLASLQLRRVCICSDAIYNITNMKAEAKLVYTNKIPITAFRGFGAMQGFFALETQLDSVCEKLGMDPIDLRLKNAVETGDVSVHGEKISSCALKECIKKVRDGINWKENRKPPQGVGMACGMYMSDARAKEGFGGSVAFVKISEDGKVSIITGESEYGQGMWNVFGQIVSEEIGVNLEDIQIIQPDTDITPFSLGPYGGGRNTISAGNAVKLAAEDAREKLLKIASERLEANVMDLEIRNGKVYVLGYPEKALSIFEIAKISVYEKGGSAIIGKGVDERNTDVMNLDTMYANYSSAYTFCAHAAELKVDVETGQVSLLNYESANDLGQPINPMASEGQIQSQIVQGGIGYGLMEEMIWEKGGSIVNPSLLEYKVPTSLDIPPMEVIIVDSEEPNGPYGAKAVGRLAIIPTPSVIANAIYNAAKIKVKNLPVTPEKILEALEGFGKNDLE